MECSGEPQAVQPVNSTTASEQEDGEEGRPHSPQEKVKRFLLATPLLSLLVGGILLVIEATVIIVFLVSPRRLGIAEESELTRAQRAVLGTVSVVMFIEAIALGSFDIGTNRQRARLIKEQRDQITNQLHKLRDKADSAAKSLFSLHQVGELLQEQILSTERIRRRLKLVPVSQVVRKTATELKELNRELNSYTLKYMASLAFDLASFLWKWALTLLVIPNNWVSVGLTIGGGVVYPLVVFWQKTIHPTA